MVDGTDHVVQESTSADPTRPVSNSVFMPEALFPAPLALTWSVTKGADLNWVPMPFEKSFRMAYSRTRYGTGYYIYQQFVRGIPLSHPLQAWDGRTPPGNDVLELINRAGTDLAPQAGAPGVVQVGGEALALGKDAILLLRDIVPKEPAMLRTLEISAPREQAISLGRARLRVTWDDEKQPSIDAPLALFFGAGTLYNRDGREYLVKAFPVHIRFDAERVSLACYFPMPFFRAAKIELIGDPASDVTGVRWSARYEPYRDPASQVGYFHATYRDHPNPVRGKDQVLLDTREAEGGGDWSGQFVGTSFIFSDRAVLSTLEGDPRFFFDDSQTPQAQGTGTEEWGGGGDYWGGNNMTLPFAGHPTGARSAEKALNEEDKIESAYRFLLADMMPFGRNAVIRLEHGGTNESTEHYQTVTYWYGRHGATLIKTDELKIGDTASEAAHRYTSPQASTPYEITSRYEWGPDSMPGVGDQPRAEPEDLAEFTFQAEANKPYNIWVRGKNLDGKNSSDAFWMQFDDDIGTTHMAASYAHRYGFGNWLDRFPAHTSAWSSALPQEAPRTVTSSPAVACIVCAFRCASRAIISKKISPQGDQTTLPVTIATAISGRRRRNHPGTGRRRKLFEGQDQAGFRRASRAGAGPGDRRDAVTGRAGWRGLPGAHRSRPEDCGRSPSSRSNSIRETLASCCVASSTTNSPINAPKSSSPMRRARTGSPPGSGIWPVRIPASTPIPRSELRRDRAHNALKPLTRRFRDDEFLVPRDLTAGRKIIRVRVNFTPVNIPLFPGLPLDEQAWSEIRYDVYCFVVPSE